MFGGYTLAQIQANPQLYNSLGPAARRGLAAAGYTPGGPPATGSGPPMATPDPRAQILQLLGNGANLPPEVLQRLSGTLGLNANFATEQQVSSDPAWEWFRQGEAAAGRTATAESFNRWWLQQQVREALAAGQGGNAALGRVGNALNAQYGDGAVGPIAPRPRNPAAPPRPGSGDQPSGGGGFGVSGAFGPDGSSAKPVTGAPLPGRPDGTDHPAGGDRWMGPSGPSESAFSGEPLPGTIGADEDPAAPPPPMAGPLGPKGTRAKPQPRPLPRRPGGISMPTKATPAPTPSGTAVDPQQRAPRSRAVRRIPGGYGRNYA